MIRIKTYPQLNVIITFLFVSTCLVSCNTETGRTLEPKQTDQTGTVFKPKHPTHKTVCDCKCIAPGPERIGDKIDQTYNIPAGGCSTLNSTKCKTGDGQEGKLKGCTKDTVQTSLVQGADALEIAP